MIDTANSVQVAADANKELFEDALRGKPQALPAMVLRTGAFDNNPTEPEYEALEALRLWTHAQTNPLVHARASALRELAYVLLLFDTGNLQALTEFFMGHDPVEVGLYMAAHQLHGILTGRMLKVHAPDIELPNTDLLSIFAPSDVDCEKGA